MNIRRERPARKQSRLENEVILAVVMLYLLLSGSMLAIHFVVPADAGRVTSSTSPSQDHRVREATPRRATPAKTAPAPTASTSDGAR